MTPEDQSLLTSTASAGDVEQLRTLLTAAEEPPSEKTVQDLLQTAVESSQLDVLKFLLIQYPSVPLVEDPVRTAVNKGSVPMFEALFARDPSIVTMRFDKRGSPLTVACMGRQTIDYLRFLLELGADPNQDPEEASFPLALVAALYKDPDAIDLLLQHGAHMEHSGALGSAASLGNESMIQRLLDRGARLDNDNAPLRSALSPLNIAVRRERTSVVKILLQHGADPNVADSTGTTPIGEAERLKLQGKDMSEMLEVLQGKQKR